MGWLADRLGIRSGYGTAQLRKTNIEQFSTFERLSPVWAKYQDELFVRYAYRQNPIVYRAIEYNAQAISMATMYAYREGVNGEEKLTHGHHLQRFLRRPSYLYPTQTRWVRMIVRQLLITGECFVFLGRDKSGMVAKSQILPGGVMQIVLGEDRIDHYLYQPTGHVKPIKIKPRNMIFFRLDDPLDPSRGTSPLAVAWREAQTDNSASDFRKAFFDNAAIPGGVLRTTMPANAEQLAQWSADWEKFRGASNAGKTPVLAGGLEYQRAGATPKEIDFGSVTGLSETRICSAFGVDPSLIGAKVGIDSQNYSNRREARAAYWDDQATPLMGMIEDELTVSLTQGGDPNYLAFDVSLVPAKQEDKAQMEERLRYGLMSGAVTVNEYREKNGLNTISDGDVYYRPTSVTQVPKGKLNEEPADPIETAEKMGEIQAKNNPQNQGQQNGGAPKKPASQQKNPQPANAKPELKAASAKVEAKARELNPAEKGVRDVIAKLLRSEAELFNSTLEDSLEALRSHKERSPRWYAGAAVNHGFDSGRMATRSATALASKVKRLARSEGLHSEAFADELAIEFANDMADTVEGVIRDELRQGLTDNVSVFAIRERIESRLDEPEMHNELARRAGSYMRLVANRENQEVNQ
jgi:HK97 family phage portal protein